MGRFVEDMLRSRYGGSRDGRNPYGSRGGYVTSRSPRRDRGMEDYRREEYEPRDYGDYRGDYNSGDYNRGGYDYDDYGYDDYRSREYEYEDGRRGVRGTGRYGMGGSRYYGRDRGMDYGEMQYGKLSKEDMEKWKHKLENADGSHGEHFKKEQLEPVVRQMNIDIERMGGMDVFCMAVNMMYADYCAVARKFGVDRIEYYVELAKAFMEDKDFAGKGEEKLWLYYKCIVSDD